MLRTFSILTLLVLLCSAAWAQAPLPMSVQKTIEVDGLHRKYRVFVPADAKGPLPLVVMLHGGGTDGQMMERYIKFDEAAQREGFVVIYPDAVDGNWNDGRGMSIIRSQREKIDDVKFIRASIDAVAKEHSIDRGRIFASGISNGGMMSHRLAAEASDVFAAIAPVSGGMAPPIAEQFQPKYPVSILLIQGDADPIVPFGGGEITLGLGRKRGTIIPTKDALAKYVERSAAQGEPAISKLEGKQADGTSVEIAKYPDGSGGVKTEYYLVKNGGHTWPGRPPYLPESVIGKASQAFSASDVIAEFFKSCPARASGPTAE